MSGEVAKETTHPVMADVYCLIIANSRTPITVTPTRINNQPHPLIEIPVNSTTVGCARFNTIPDIRRPAPIASGSSLISYTTSTFMLLSACPSSILAKHMAITSRTARKL